MSNFTDAHLRLVAALSDTQTDGSPITIASQDGIKRTSAQRSKDLMAGRYWVWSVFRIANKQMFNASANITFATNGYADITSLNITTPEELGLLETSAYGKPVPVVVGTSLPLFYYALNTSHGTEMVAGIQNDVVTGGVQTIRLKLIVGVNMPSADPAAYSFTLNYYANPVLEELTAASTNDFTEPRSWLDAIEKYAESVAWRASGNFQRSLETRREAFDLVVFEIETQHGTDAASRVSQFLKQRSE